MASIPCPNCGASLKTQSAIQQDKKIKCPKCARPFVVEAGDGGQSAKERAKRAESPPKKASRGMVLGIAGGVLALCLCGAVVPGAAWFFRDKLGFGPSAVIVKEDAAVKNGKDEAKDNDRDKNKDKVPDPALIIDPAEFAKTYKESSGTYRGKLVEVTGKVSGFSLSLDKRPVVLVPASERGLEPIFHVISLEKEPWNSYAIDQTVKVRGTFGTSVATPSIENAYVSAVTPGKTLVFNAPDLAAEAVADPEKTEAKYKGKGLIVMGEVLKIERGNNTVWLKGQERPIRMEMIDRGRPELGKLVTVGQLARIYGVFWDLLPPDLDKEKSHIRLQNCLPITGAK